MAFSPDTELRIFEKLVVATAARTDLSDITTSGSVLGFLRAVASELAEGNLSIGSVIDLFGIDTASGSELIQVAQTIVPGRLRRGSARRATAVVTFSRPVPSAPTTIIRGAGQTVQSNSGQIYTTLAPAVIDLLNTTSNEVAVAAVSAGPDGNAEVGTITTITGDAGGFTGVTNITPAVGGRTQESDPDFRGRIKVYVESLSRSTSGGIRGNLLSFRDPVSGRTILFAQIWEDPTVFGRSELYIDDGTGSITQVEAIVGNVVIAAAAGGEEHLFLSDKPVNEAATITITSSIRGSLTRGIEYFLNPTTGLLYFDPVLSATEGITATYEVYRGLLASAQSLVDGLSTLIDVRPGLRAAGTLVQVLPPQILVIPVEANYTVIDGYEQVAVDRAVLSAIVQYVNSLDVHEPMLRSRLVQAVMEIPGVLNMELVLPATDINILHYQLIRITATDVTVGVL